MSVPESVKGNTISVGGRYCCKSRKSNNPKTLAKVDLPTSLLLDRFQRHYGGPWSILDETIWPLTSPPVKRISGSRNFRASLNKTDVCDGVVQCLLSGGRAESSRCYARA